MRVFRVIFICLPHLLFSQEKCATEFIPANQHRTENRVQFEKWMSEQKQQRSSFFYSGRIPEEDVYEIPVVVHIIHDGSPVGQGSNLHEDTIKKQIALLNADFRRQNEDADLTPGIFEPVAADTEIQFVLARQDPEGLPTNGIIRVQGSKTEYRPTSDDALLKSESFWPPEQYMNLYITNLSSGNLGYAQFPFSNLEGIAPELENYRLTDGVVLDYQWVGLNNATGSFDSKGRTATHEVGHFLGLRHIWGDGGTNCMTDDYCMDTPQMEHSTTGCPASKNTCFEEEGTDLPDMIQNYMDYTDDECMNLFTLCQKERMRTVLESSPRRVSLLNSPALQEPIITVNDLGIRSVINPSVSQCAEDLIPQVQVRNYGINPINSFELELRINGVIRETITVENPLDPLELADVLFSPVSINSAVSNTFTFQVKQVNGVDDGKPSNDLATISRLPFDSQLLPYTENFETDYAVFRTTENGAESTWVFTTAPDSLAGNQAAVLPFYENPANFGIQDLMITRVLDLSSITSAQISFSYAYAPRRIDEGGSFFHLDGLMVAVSTNCGAEFLTADYLFERYGQSLATTADQSSSFIPSSSDEWEEVTLNLTNHTGHENVQVAFIGVNGGGNNLYIDNITITSANLLALDAGLRSVGNLPVISCSQSFSPVLEIKNYGYERIQQLKVLAELNDQSETLTFYDLNIFSGFNASLSLLSAFTEDSAKINWTYQDGANHVRIDILEINGEPDQQNPNDSLNLQVVVNDEQESIPVKEDFSNLNWTLASPSGDSVFVIENVDRNEVLVARGFHSVMAGNPNYLISPILSTSGYQEAAIRFRYAYKKRAGFNDQLKILLSNNCGKNFETEVFSFNSDLLATSPGTSEEEWVPQNEADWQTAFVDISEHLIWADLRVALVFINGNGNNLYIDDVEVLTSSNPDLPAFTDLVTIYPNPTSDAEFNVALNLFSKQDVVIRLMDMSGKIVFSAPFPGAINQTYRFIAPNQSGIYFLQILGSDGVLNQVKRLHIRR